MHYTPASPTESNLFDPVADAYGNRLALVFGNEFKDGRCPFYQKQCHHCDIGAGEGIEFDSDLNRQRLEFFKHYYRPVLPEIAHLVIYNSGSTLNRREMSPETLREILDYASSLRKCKVVSFDSREAYITDTIVKHLVASLRGDQQVRVILGIESQSDDIRIGKLKKIMTKPAIEKVFATLGQYERKVGLDINILFQPPELTGDAAIAEAVRTAEYSLELSQRYDVPVDFNFHPYYPSQKSKMRYPNHPRADIKAALKASCLMKELIEARHSDSMVFIGWQDESHDQEQAKRVKELERSADIFNDFNICQDVAILYSVTPQHLRRALRREC